MVLFRAPGALVDLRTLAAGIAAWAAAASVALRSVIASSFDSVVGDRGDSRLVLYLHEHLYNALHGRAEFLSPPIFYPQKNVLGLTDAFVLDIPPYAALRAIGLDPFLSIQIWAIVLSLGCFLACLVICRRFLGLRLIIALCAAVLATFPNNLLFKTGIGHIQFYALYYIPGIVLLALWSIEGFPRVTPKSLALMALAAALFALLCATEFYVAWLFALTVIIAVIVAAVFLRGDLTMAATQRWRPAAKLFAAAAIGFLAGIVPLLLIYAPALATFSGRTFRDFVSFSPFPKDVINVGEWNLLWGWLVERVLGDTGAERPLAVTPGLALIFLVMAYRLRPRAGDRKRQSWQPTFFATAAMVLVLSWLLTARIGTFSLFWIPYHLIPGAVAIRAGGRIQLLANLWVALGLAVLLQYWIDTAAAADRRRRVVITGAILAFCFVEQINLFPAGSLSRSRELAWLAAVPRPPAECQVFLIDAPRPWPTHIDQNDAMWISLRTGLPTINGSSGWDPPGWHLDERDIDYFAAARQWIAQTKIDKQVCLYDRRERTWSRFR